MGGEFAELHVLLNLGADCGEIHQCCQMAAPWRCHGGLTWWKFEKMPPNRGGMAGWDGGHGGIADIFLVFCAVGVRLTRPNLTRN